MTLTFIVVTGNMGFGGNDSIVAFARLHNVSVVIHQVIKLNLRKISINQEWPRQYAIPFLRLTHTFGKFD